ncbi:MAG: MFS transporter [Acidobacteria bacterium]|nr:MAG: MFS transporter [Acidobacteriota bacterium]REJ99052.1 MAG: MFS transporter [Acidobacteriota bacterium]REK16227.1 MAG: MFS transporter [Acidobacteriota bacterium]REK43908.1 MAG: MFS transporter [Acidobacteriota bacterium]
MSATHDSAAGVELKGFFGHPRGLSTLFFTEMWERFSFYGMRAILFLYMTAAIANGGLGWDPAYAGPIYGLYASSVYFLPLIGGWIADRFIGAYRATFIGGVIIMLGHFSLAVPTITFFYLGLVLVAVGTGFLKSNISAMVGDLYTKEDERRDAGFSIFYMGINIGAMIAPLVCGYLAQDQYFRTVIAGWGIDPNSSWHFGFAAAGVGMALGLVQYIVGKRHLKGVGEPPKTTPNEEGGEMMAEMSTGYLIQIVALIVISVALIAGAAYFYGFDFSLSYVLMPVVLVAGLLGVLLTGMQDKLSVDDWKRLGVITVLFTFSMLFWMGFEQAATSLNLFAEKLTETTLFGYNFPASWLQTVNPAFIVILAPVFAWIWVAMGKRQPTDAVKFAFGLFFAGLGFVVVGYAASFTDAGKVTFWWLILVYLLHTIGELCLSPVGLSSMTKLAPGNMVSLMLGVWFLSISMGNYVAGRIAGEFQESATVLTGIFSNVAIILIVGAVVLLLISPLVKKLYIRDEEEAA